MTATAPLANRIKPEKQPGLGAPLIATYLVAALAIGLPLWITISATARGQDTAEPFDGVWAMQAIVILWSAARIAQLFWTGKPRLMALTFWVYVYVFLGVAPWAQMVTGSSPGDGYATRENELTATGIVLFGIAAYELAALIARRTEHRNRFTGLQDFSTGRLWIFAVVGLVFSAYYVYTLGFSTLFQYRAARFDAATGQLGGSQVVSIISALATTPSLIAALGFIDKRREQGKGYLLIITILIIDVLLLTNPISSSRFGFGVYIGSIAIILFKLCSARARTRALIAAALIVLIIAFPYADRFRKEASATSVYSSQSIADQMSTKLDYDSYAQIALTDRYVDRNGHTLGKQGIGAVLAPVPRSVWEGKPLDTGIVLGTFAGYSFLSISSPLWAEAWIDGGWFWLAVLFFGLGFLATRLDSGFLLAAQRRSGVLYAAVPVLALYQIMTLRGSLLQQMSALMVIVICFAFARGRTRKA